MQAGLDGIAETLLIPVRARAHETNRPDALLLDPWAVSIIKELDLGGTDKDKVSEGTLIGTVLRTRLFDQKLIAFMEKHPHGTVVNLGCGLDARYERLCLRSVQWIDLDVPEAINLRRRFFNEAANYKMLSGSMFDGAWMASVPRDKPVMVLFEGVSMYFPESELKPFVLEVFEQFPQADMVFDVLSKTNANNTQRHPDVKKYNAPFKWGIDSADELRQWDGAIQVVSDESYMVKKPLNRWPLSMRLMRWMPSIRRLGRVVHIRYEKSGKNA